MKKYKFISRIRGIYQIDEYKEVIAKSLNEAEGKLEDYKTRYSIFSITK